MHLAPAKLSLAIFYNSLMYACITQKLSVEYLQSRSEFGNQWTGPYYGGHFYDGYGYAFQPPHDPGMYAAYGAYPVYGTHQQQVS